MDKYLKPWVDLNGLLEALPGKWSKRYIRYLVHTKQIPHFKPTPRKLLFNLNKIEEWLENSQVGDDN